MMAGSGQRLGGTITVSGGDSPSSNGGNVLFRSGQSANMNSGQVDILSPP